MIEKKDFDELLQLYNNVQNCAFYYGMYFDKKHNKELEDAQNDFLEHFVDLEIEVLDK